MLFIVLFVLIFLFSILALLMAGGQQFSIFCTSINSAGENYLSENQLRVMTLIGAVIGSLFWYIYQPVELFVKILPPAEFINDTHYIAAMSLAYFITALMLLFTIIFKFPSSPMLVLIGGLFGLMFLEVGSFSSFNYIALSYFVALIFLFPLLIAGLHFLYFRFIDQKLLLKYRPREQFIYIMTFLILIFGVVGLSIFGKFLGYYINGLSWTITMSVFFGAFLIFAFFYLKEFVRRQAFKVTDDKRGLERAFRQFQWIPLMFNLILFGAIEIGFFLLPVTIFWHFMVNKYVAVHFMMPFWLYFVAAILVWFGVWFFSRRIRHVFVGLFKDLTNSRSFSIQYGQSLLLSSNAFLIMPVVPMVSYFGAHLGLSVYDTKWQIFKEPTFYKILFSWIFWPALTGGVTALSFFIARFFL